MMSLITFFVSNIVIVFPSEGGGGGLQTYYTSYKTEKGKEKFKKEKHQVGRTMQEAIHMVSR